MGVIARLLGVFLLLAAVFYTRVAKRYTRITGSVMQATILQYVFVPLVTGLGLVITGKFAILVVGLVVWILAPVPSIGQILFLAYPLVSGWVFGVNASVSCFSASKLSGYVGGGVGAVLVYLVPFPLNKFHFC